LTANCDFFLKPDTKPPAGTHTEANFGSYLNSQHSLPAGIFFAYAVPFGFLCTSFRHPSRCGMQRIVCCDYYKFIPLFNLTQNKTFMKSLLNLAIVASVVGMMFACTNDSVSPDAVGGGAKGGSGGGTEARPTTIQFSQSISGNDVTISYSVNRTNANTQEVNCGTIAVTYTSPGSGNSSKATITSNSYTNGQATFKATKPGDYNVTVAYTPAAKACNFKSSSLTKTFTK
jgi:hypothetical protein